MKDNEEEGEPSKSVNKVQWVLGESMFRAKRLKTLVANNEEINHALDRDINVLILVLPQITNLYRHNIAERTKGLTIK